MNSITSFFVFTIITLLTFLNFRRTFPSIVRDKAEDILDDIVFPKGNHQKHEIIQVVHDITNYRFEDEEVLDYYYKMKGLCILGRNCQLNFWLRNYLFAPSLIKLNYFEQYRFYEMFLRCS